ncbi:terminase TerL endonuclease subunit [Clostridium magnum]|uniref:Phage terminase n=1 Tax=Clostridium magnum DSM 2767 TaxID=1121326 RepID=A0A168E1C7_9CLOT|nr:terminase TerL endonuclease subunit [Clostridium magnum]KZL93547.1 phage terminase [Clostridium magnum DSM 2767]SHI61125.1 Phage terminase-like protein, large subunit, contains N-terminal HTH domain [Clostridium magnum DSM 2767]
MEVKESKAYKYAEWCIVEPNRKVPRYVKKQAKEWLDIADGKSNEAYVDEKELNKINKLLKLMVHPDLMCPMDEGLEDYAWLLIVATLCTKLKNDENKDIRYYITAVLEISRKNFKTFNSAVIFILLLLTDKPFSRFFSVAPDLKLSSELKIAIRKIIKVSPLLAEEDVFKVLRSEIRCLLTDSEYVPLAYSEDRMDGKLANAFLADEAGAMDSYPIEAMRSSQITLFNKLGIIISTQYPNDNNAMIDEIDISKKTLDGLIDNRRRFALLYEPDDEFLVEDKWQTEDLVIYQSNPVAVAHDYIFQAIKDMRIMAILYENKRENYLCKHNNIKYKGLGVEGYIEITKVRECKIKEDLSFWEGKRVYLGLDLSQTDDNTSVAMVTEHEGKIYVKVWGFIPSDKKDYKSKRENVDYNKLIKQGVCFECGDEVIDYGFVETFITGDNEHDLKGLEEEYGVEITQIGYDRYNAISTVQKLEAAGYECVEIKQHSSVLHMPTKLIKEHILSKNFCYDENLMLEINFQNARCTEDTNLNKYVNKKKSAGKVDMVVSTINAVYLLQQDMLFGEDDFGAQVI